MATPMKSPDEKSVTDSENNGWRCIDVCQILPKARKKKPIIINTSAFFDLVNTGKSPKLIVIRSENGTTTLMQETMRSLPAAVH